MNQSARRKNDQSEDAHELILEKSAKSSVAPGQISTAVLALDVSVQL